MSTVYIYVFHIIILAHINLHILNINTKSFLKWFIFSTKLFFFGICLHAYNHYINVIKSGTNIIPSCLLLHEHQDPQLSSISAIRLDFHLQNETHWLSKVHQFYPLRRLRFFQRLYIMAITLKLQVCTATRCIYKTSFSTVSQVCIRVGLTGILALSRLPYYGLQDTAAHEAAIIKDTVKFKLQISIMFCLCINISQILCKKSLAVF